MVNTRVAQVMNVSSAATMEQLRTLFGFLGKIEDIRMFPKEDSVLPVTVRICFVRFEDPTSVGMAQHLTNTVFLDKALTIMPYPDGVIPEESKALQMVAATSGGLASMISGAGAGLLPTPPQPLLGQTITGGVSESLDPTLSALGLPQPPPLSNVDPSKVEEIRRTIYVGNLDSGTITAEQLLNFFQKIGEVKYVRMAGDETQPTRFAFVEFSDQPSVTKALAYNGVMFAGRPLKINHSNNAIVKPPAKTQEAIQKELAQTMKQVRDAQALIQAAIDPDLCLDSFNQRFLFDLKGVVESTLEPQALKAATLQDIPKETTSGIIPAKKPVFDSVIKDKKRSRSRSRSRRRSRSRSRKRSRSRGRSRRSRSRPRSDSRPKQRRSRSPRRRSPRRRSRSRSRHRHTRSKSKDRRSKSREKRKKSRTPPRGYRPRQSRSRSRSKSPRKVRSPSKKQTPSRSRSTSPKKSSKHKKEKKRDRSKDREKNKDKESRSSSRKKREKEVEKESTEASSEKKEKKEDEDSKVKRDYDEEEKGFAEEVDNNKSEDMDVDSD